MTTRVLLFTGDGIQWSNFNKPVNASDSFTMAHIYMMLIIDCILYGLICWYVDAVKPGDYGIPQKWYFPVTVRCSIVYYKDLSAFEIYFPTYYTK